MKHCVVCKKETDFQFDYQFHVLEVQTLHVRDLDRERRVQALGGFRDFAVCRDCAKERLELDMDYRKAVRPKVIPFGLVLLAGAVLFSATIAFFEGNRVFLMLGLAAIACGLIGVVTAISEGKKRSEALSGMSKEDAQADAAWTAMLDRAPRKESDSDLTYIPVDAKTLNRKKGDLMVLYDLLPDIAVKAYDLIHREYRQEQ